MSDLSLKINCFFKSSKPCPAARPCCGVLVLMYFESAKRRYVLTISIHHIKSNSTVLTVISSRKVDIVGFPLPGATFERISHTFIRVIYALRQCG
jgi:hypothetical protein